MSGSFATLRWLLPTSRRHLPTSHRPLLGAPVAWSRVRLAEERLRLRLADGAMHQGKPEGRPQVRRLGVSAPRTALGHALQTASEI
jgi:hypothetical protein